GVAAGKVVNPHEVKAAAFGKRAKVAVNEHHRNAGFMKFGRDALVGLGTVSAVLKGDEENPHDATFDELIAQRFSFLDAHFGLWAVRLGGATPEQPVVVHVGEAGEFAADGFKNLGVTEARHDQTELGEPGRGGGRLPGIAE